MPKSLLPYALAPLFALALPALRADTPPQAPEAAPAAVSDADVAALKQQLADVQDKLATALHSYSLLDDQNSKLKDQEGKEAAELAVLRPQAPLAAQAQALRERVRQLQDQVAELAADNARLKTRLALLAPLPGTAPRASTASTR